MITVQLFAFGGGFLGEAEVPEASPPWQLLKYDGRIFQLSPSPTSYLPRYDEVPCLKVELS